jgi:hypothetical protein
VAQYRGICVRDHIAAAHEGYHRFDPVSTHTSAGSGHM